MRTIALVTAALMIAAVAYWVGTQQAGRSATSPLQQQVVPTPSASKAASTAEQHAAAGLPKHSPMATPAARQPSASTPPGVEFEHFRVGNRNVKAILSDGDVMWVGTSGGVVRYDLETDEHRLFDVRSGLLSNGIFHLSKLGDRLAVGTYGGGLSIFNADTESWDNYNVQHGMGDAFVYDMLEMTNGDVWIATWSGANRIRNGNLDDREAWETYTVENTAGGLPNDWVYGLAAGKNGEIWMATEGGLARYLDGKWSNWQHDDGLGADYDLVRNQIRFTRDPAKESSHHARQKREMGLMNVDIAYNPNYIISLLVDDAGVVWCGTWGGGLSRFDGNEWKTFSVRDGLPGNHVFMLGRESQGRMWVGTGNGLARFDGEKFTVFGMNDGLFAETIFSMTYGEEGTLWLGSYGGVAKIKGLENVN